MGMDIAVRIAGLAGAAVRVRNLHRLSNIDGGTQHFQEDAGVQDRMTGNQFEFAVTATVAWDEHGDASRSLSADIAGLLMADDPWGAGSHVKKIRLPTCPDLMAWYSYETSCTNGYDYAEFDRFRVRLGVQRSVERL